MRYKEPHWVYEIYHPTTNELLYVGMTVNLEQRLRTHKPRFCPDFEPFVIAKLYGDWATAHKVEMKLVIERWPKHNVQGKGNAYCPTCRRLKPEYEALVSA